jgi:hypothetical protein
MSKHTMQLPDKLMKLHEPLGIPIFSPDLLQASDMTCGISHIPPTTAAPIAVHLATDFAFSLNPDLPAPCPARRPSSKFLPAPLATFAISSPSLPITFTKFAIEIPHDYYFVLVIIIIIIIAMQQQIIVTIAEYISG